MIKSLKRLVAEFRHRKELAMLRRKADGWQDYSEHCSTYKLYR